MSYCRWSSDFGECDVYVYEDVSGGWTTHIAERRLKHKVPDKIKAMYYAINWDTDGASERHVAYYEVERAWREALPGEWYDCQILDPVTKVTKPGKMHWIADSEYEALPEEWAGQSYNDPTPGECAARLRELKAAGLNVPDYAIKALEEEQQEMDNEG